MNYNVSGPIQRMLLPLVLAMVLYSGASSLHATGEGVQVVSDTTDIKIPFEVTFQLQVKSDVEIKDIQLNYRNEHGGNWNYSYLEFDSYTNVSSSFTLDLTGSNYIPPGSKIEYFYTITDVLGDLNLTDRTRFMLIDPRFSWRSTSVGNFTLWWHDQSSEKIEEIATRFQRSLGRLEKTLDLPQPKDERYKMAVVCEVSVFILFWCFFDCFRVFNTFSKTLKNTDRSFDLLKNQLTVF